MALIAGPLVSIVTPVYNGAHYLEDLIQSVLGQDYPNIEHLIIDDGSQDNGATRAILQKYPHIRWWSGENKGQYATMNEGLLAANGEVICFVNADDLVAAGAVSSVVEFLSRHPRYDGVFGMTTRVDSGGTPVPYFIPFQAAPMFFYPHFAHISHCSLYVTKKPLHELNLLFNASLTYNGDYDWMIRIYESGLKIGFLRRELARVRLHTEQTSQKNATASRLEAKNVIAAHHINRWSYGFLNTFYRLLVYVWCVPTTLKKDGFVSIIKRRLRKFQR